MSTDPARTVDITEGDSVIVDFTYAVKWRETTVPFERRMDKYSRYSFLPQHLEARVPASVPRKRYDRGSGVCNQARPSGQGPGVHVSVLAMSPAPMVRTAAMCHAPRTALPRC